MRVGVTKMKKGHRSEIANLLFAREIRLVAALPGTEGLLEASVIGNVLVQRQGAIDVLLAAIRSLEREVAVLAHEAFCLLVERRPCLVCPPLRKDASREKILRC